MKDKTSSDRTLLQRVARETMAERDLWPAFSPRVQSETSRLTSPTETVGDDRRDLRHLLWASIDNDDSRDLDQLTCAERVDEDAIKLYVAVADVDHLVEKASAIDQHASHNTTSVYTPAQIFSMLPTRLSHDLTSLNPDVDRAAMVVEILVRSSGSLQDGGIYPAVVRNHAQLTYNGVGPWLEGAGPLPEGVARIAGLEENLRLQHTATQMLREMRSEHGALELETIQARPFFDERDTLDIALEEPNPAKELIEDAMIAANSVTARFLQGQQRASLRRVVRSPARWERIVDLAATLGAALPKRPDSKALAAFLAEQHHEDPLRFPDLSLAVIKLIGSGEYVVEYPGDSAIGHFGLAVRNYTHSTAPNRRFPDLITQRLVKAALANIPACYRDDELEQLAEHCTRKEDDAAKVERKVNKSAVALVLDDRVGECFDALVTGSALKGTWVRILDPPVEGKLVRGAGGIDVGDRIQVELIEVNAARGYIDFARCR